MAITFPINFPAYNKPSRVRLIMNDTVARFTDPFSKVGQVQDFGGRWWEAVVTLPPMQRDKAEEYASFVAKLRGRRGTFLMGVSSAGTAQGSPAGTPEVVSQSVDGLTIETEGWANSTAVLLEGDYIQIGQHLYKVMEDVTSDASGDATVEIWPNLRPNIGTGAITFTNPRGIWELSDNARAFDIDTAKHYGITFACKEALR